MNEQNTTTKKRPNNKIPTSRNKIYISVMINIEYIIGKCVV